jgi:hypothetical protein
MASRGRGRLFAAAGLMVVGAALLLVLFSQGRAATRADRGWATTGAAKPVVQGIGGEEPRPGRPPRTARIPSERAANEDRPVRPRAASRGLETAEAAAKAFLSGLLRHESGEGGPRARCRIIRRGTRDFGHFVLAREPRVPAATNGPARARLVDLEPVQLSDGRAELAATIERDGTRSGLLVTLARREGRWRVADLR